MRLVTDYHAINPVLWDDLPLHTLARELEALIELTKLSGVELVP